MNYTQITISVSDPAIREILVAVLSGQGYEGFEEEENVLHAFIPEEQFSVEELEDVLKGNAGAAAGNPSEPSGEGGTDMNDGQPGGPELKYTRQLIQPKNWNEQWERDFQPVVVEGFCAVRAFFHAPIAGVRHDLLITPKMSFGTGHHATTYMMMEAMQFLELKGAEVLDFGTGTGVLAILAEKSGASRVLAIDNDDWSIENALENVASNGCKAVSVQKMDQIPPGSLFRIILANINKNVILRELGEMGQHLKEGGVILLSGLLQEDAADIEKKAAQHNFSISTRMTNGSWICLKLE